jgi:hypothetical protein
MLTDEQKTEIRERLAANENTRAGEAWQGRDVNELADDELLAFNRWHESLQPLEKGLACSCGRKHVYNWDARAWKETGTPKAAKLPSTVAEFIANGGGSQEDREAWQVAQQVARERRNDVLERLTANMAEEKRAAFWEKHQQTKIEDLTEMLDLVGDKAQQEPPRPTANYFGAHGAPPAGGIAANVPALVPPVLEYGPRKKAV